MQETVIPISSGTVSSKGVLCMIFVKAAPGDSSDSVIRKFTRKVIAEGLLLEFRKKEFYQKPAEVRKQAKNVITRRDKARKRNKRTK